MEDRSRVQSYLRGALPDCELTTERVAEGYEPLVFLWMAHLMVAFAFAYGDTRASYRELYESFKRYYSRNRDRLDAVDLSFVFCVSSSAKDLDEFRSELETDVYFCRKYVVPLTESLEGAFDRLPFLPLGLGAGLARRPPAAQTCMRQWNVPPELARQLAVPYQRSAQSIVKDCIENYAGVVPLLTSVRETAISARDRIQHGGEVRLDEVTISSFRAYKKRQVFDLSSDVTVVYGPNGFGKTSLFDAIDFVATGGVGRLGVSSRTDRFARAVAHLDNRIEDGSVSLRFGMNGVKKNVSRRVASRASATLDGSSVDRKRALIELTGGVVTPDDRVEHLVSLFRATHLFSQENQELAREFDRDCSLPPRVVSYILAFDDYGNVRRKASDVCQIIQEEIAQRKTSVAALQREIIDTDLEIKKLSETSVRYDHEKELTAALIELKRRTNEVGIALDSENLDRTFVRSCRATVQARIAESDSRTRRLTELLNQIRALPSLSDRLATLQRRHTALENELEAANDALTEANQSAADASALVDKLREWRTVARTTVESLRWVQEAKPRYASLLRRQHEAAKAVSDGRTLLDELRELRSEASRSISGTEKQVAATEARLVTMSTTVSELHELAELAEGITNDQDRLSILHELLVACNKRLRASKAEKATTERRLARRATERDRITQDITKIDREESELAHVLSRVATYVDGGRCPLCGHDHGSMDELLGRISAQSTPDLSSMVRRELAEVEEAIRMSQRRLGELQESVAEETVRLEEFLRERADRSERVAKFREAAKRMGIVTGELSSAIEEIGRRQVQAQLKIEETEHSSAMLERKLEEARGQISAIDRRIDSAVLVTNDAEVTTENCEIEIRKLLDNPWLEVVSFETESTSIAERNEHYSLQLKELEEAFAQAVEAHHGSRDVASDARQRVSNIEASIDTVRREIVARRRAISETEARLMEGGLSAESGEDEVVALMEQEANDNRRLVVLSDFADSIEVAMDTAMTAAALQEQRRSIRRKGRRVEEMSRDISTYEEWAKFFAELSDKIAGTQDAAIKDFADGYGPMASAIQQRLRPVYGFDGIATRSHNATIQVRVKRGGETLRPTDFFSHSQQRTLLLGLFLTAGMSQSWSSLSTMLLDDPITHFDDVNTYAFFDMISGLLHAEWGPQQVVLSTCDKRVFHLARSKFRFLGSAAKFYGISAIGRDGPVVVEFPAG